MLRLTSFQKPQFQSVSIFVHSCPFYSCYVIYTFFSYSEQFFFYILISLVEVTTVSILINFTTQLLYKKRREKKRKRERKKKPCLTCFFSSFSSTIDGSSCFSGSATGTSAVSDFSLLRLFLFSFFLSFSCFSFLYDLSLRCLRLDSLDSVF